MKQLYELSVSGKDGRVLIVEHQQYTSIGPRTVRSVMIENADGFTDWPIQYDDGSIAYDHPEKFPRYLKDLVPDAFVELKKLKRRIHVDHADQETAH